MNHQALNMKLNWDMLEKRSKAERNDFLMYDGEELIGFLGLYGFGPKPVEIELTGMVHPDYREKGIFSALYAAAKNECVAREAKRILLVLERSSPSGVGFAKSLGAQYAHSEYRMKFEGTSVPAYNSHGVTLRKTELADHPKLIALDALCFGVSEAEVESSHADHDYTTTYVAELNGEFIGKIGTLVEAGAGYVFGVAVEPLFRGKGYGKALLCMGVEKLLAENIYTSFLEVAVQNESALHIYKSSGFNVVSIYDYYLDTLS